MKFEPMLSGLDIARENREAAFYCQTEVAPLLPRPSIPDNQAEPTSSQLETIRELAAPTLELGSQKVAVRPSWDWTHTVSVRPKVNAKRLASIPSPWERIKQELWLNHLSESEQRTLNELREQRKAEQELALEMNKGRREAKRLRKAAQAESDKAARKADREARKAEREAEREAARIESSLKRGAKWLRTLVSKPVWWDCPDEFQTRLVGFLSNQEREALELRWTKVTIANNLLNK